MRILLFFGFFAKPFVLAIDDVDCCCRRLLSSFASTIMLTEPTVAFELAKVFCSFDICVLMMCDLFEEDFRGEFEFVFGVVPRGLRSC